MSVAQRRRELELEVERKQREFKVHGVVKFSKKVAFI